MNFLCTCCKKRITKEQKIPEFLAGTIMHSKAYHMEWAVFDAEEMSRPIQERKWSERNIQPKVGDKRILRVKAPFDE